MVRLIEHHDIIQFHRLLTKFNQKRLVPQTFDQGSWQSDLETEFAMRLAEGDMIENDLKYVRGWLKNVPTDADSFVGWFNALKINGPGQNDPLFDWIAREATYPEMKWFIEQEVNSEASFDDLIALTQVKLPTRAKLELARIYWDEMGRGDENKMHGYMLSCLAERFKIRSSDFEIVPETLALGNLLVGLATNRRYAYHSVGALGVVELTAPGRAAKIFEGLKRLEMESSGQGYYQLHSKVDTQHSESWNREVIRPLIQTNPELVYPIAEGALIRLYAGARCFERYREVLWNKNPVRMALHHSERHQVEAQRYSS